MYKYGKSTVRNRLFFFQAEDGIRDLVRSRGLGDVYKRQIHQSFIDKPEQLLAVQVAHLDAIAIDENVAVPFAVSYTHLTLPTSDLV